MRKIILTILFSLLVCLLTIPLPTYAADKEATIVSHTIPSTMQAGTTYPVSITVRNDGTRDWSAEELYRLGDVNDSDPFSYGRKLILNGKIIKPGEYITFSFDMTAPSSSGSYLTDWRMLQEGVTWFGETLAVQVSVVRTIPFSSATIISENIPAVMAKGYLYPVTITVRNDGGDTWSHLHRLGGVGDSDPFANTRQLIPDGQSVPPGKIQTFSFMMQAPDAVGSYVTDWRMVHENVSWFGQTLTKSVQVVEANRDAIIIANTIPAVMEAGQSYDVTITMLNTGNTTWYENGKAYRLGAVGNEDPFALGRYMLPSEVYVKPGETYTFKINMKAPGVPGNYISDWSMLQEYISWFGEVLIHQITVIDPKNTDSYHYDSAGKLEYIKLTSGKYIYYYYDSNGNLLRKVIKDH
ncbi:NBR1-Ig-like domain-containing protein [Paenibacillus typhae]|uniref:NBR1-Ig-like domain-containing protein n=1 Tax=Paenibacillus typhae TaxID=1174501 RepID=UPI001C8EA5CD|nr:NBR1-Ig-like domain-containing protein [Paenibacillus typhae]MBY0014697.1 hypothetical protein [Paenibacillus typhae]